MSSSSANAAAKRRRGVPTNINQSFQSVNTPVNRQQVGPTLTTTQAIYMLSNRVSYLEEQLRNAVSNNVLTPSTNEFSQEFNNRMSEINSDGKEYVFKDDFNQIMTSIGSDMNNMGDKVNSLQEFVMLVQNNYLTLNKICLELQERLNDSNTYTHINDKNELADFKIEAEQKAEEGDIDEQDDEEVQNSNPITLSVNEKIEVKEDITDRLKKLSDKANETTSEETENPEENPEEKPEEKTDEEGV